MSLCEVVEMGLACRFGFWDGMVFWVGSKEGSGEVGMGVEMRVGKREGRSG